MPDPPEPTQPNRLELLWLTRDPAAVRTRLNGLRGRPPEGDRVPLPPVDIVIVADDGPADRLVVGPGGSSQPPPPSWGPSLAALGWATVDAARAAAEFGRGLDGDAFDEVLLGARAQRLASEGGLPLILLEPSTEGPLAAALARNGEGPVALYVAGTRSAPNARTSGTAMGAGRLAWPSHTGPFVILLDR